MTRFFYCVFLSLVIGSFVIKPLWAQQTSPMPTPNDNMAVVIGNEKLLKFDLIRGFLALAFVKSSWNEESPHYAELFDEFMLRYNNPDYTAKNHPPGKSFVRRILL